MSVLAAAVTTVIWILYDDLNVNMRCRKLNAVACAGTRAATPLSFVAVMPPQLPGDLWTLIGSMNDDDYTCENMERRSPSSQYPVLRSEIIVGSTRLAISSQYNVPPASPKTLVPSNPRIAPCSVIFTGCRFITTMGAQSWRRRRQPNTRLISRNKVIFRRMLIGSLWRFDRLFRAVAPALCTVERNDGPNFWAVRSEATETSRALAPLVLADGHTNIRERDDSRA